MVKTHILSIIVFLTISFDVFAQNSDLDNAIAPVYAFLQKEFSVLKHNKLSNDSSLLDVNKKRIDIYLAKPLEGIALREDLVDRIYDSVSANLPRAYKNYDLTLYINRYELHDLVPNWTRSEMKLDKNRFEKEYFKGHQLVRNMSKPYEVTKGLSNRHIAMWPSHGWYFESNTKGSQWQWQRPCKIGRAHV